MHSRFLPCSRRRPRRRRNAGSRCKRRPGRRVRKAAGGKNEPSLPPVSRRSRRDLRRPALKQKRSPPLHDPQTGRSRPGHSAACLCPHRGKPLLWLDGCCKPYWEWTSFPRGNTVLLPGSPAKLPHTFFEDPMACAPYSVNLMGARTRRHASATDAVPHPLPSDCTRAFRRDACKRNSAVRYRGLVHLPGRLSNGAVKIRRTGRSSGF